MQREALRPLEREHEPRCLGIGEVGLLSQREPALRPLQRGPHEQIDEERVATVRVDEPAVLAVVLEPVPTQHQKHCDGWEYTR